MAQSTGRVLKDLTAFTPFSAVKNEPKIEGREASPICPLHGSDSRLSTQTIGGVEDSQALGEPVTLPRHNQVTEPAVVPRSNTNERLLAVSGQTDRVSRDKQSGWAQQQQQKSAAWNEYSLTNTLQASQQMHFIMEQAQGLQHQHAQLQMRAQLGEQAFSKPLQPSFRPILSSSPYAHLAAHFAGLPATSQAATGPMTAFTQHYAGCKPYFTMPAQSAQGFDLLMSIHLLQQAQQISAEASSRIQAMAAASSGSKRKLGEMGIRASGHQLLDLESLQTCSMCGTTSTPTWRRLEKKLVCNACGLRRRRLAHSTGGKAKRIAEAGLQDRAAKEDGAIRALASLTASVPIPPVAIEPHKHVTICPSTAA